LERVLVGDIDLEGFGVRLQPSAPTPALDINPIRKSS
jgi:hypothetical protein